MKVSLIITTYNWKEALQLSLKTAFMQTRMPDEVVVADDGSREDTAEMVREMRQNSPVPVLHVWQPDEGFRAARSRNNAIVASSGDYLIFLDGDCFVNKYFVADHLSVVQKNQSIAGTRVNIVPRRQQYIFATGNTHISFFSWGTRKKFNAIRSPLLARFYRSKGGMATANCSMWREDVYRINGFNELFVGYGLEDAEFAIRLNNAGVAKKRVGHIGMAYHMAHVVRQCPHGEEIAKLLGAATKLTWCERGLDAPRSDCEIRTA
jgi:GT2 family glycosyltransferase